MKTKFNSHCVVCKKPCVAPRGNWNAQLASLCPSKKCRHKRKIELQKERRRQREMFPELKKSKFNSHAKASKTSRAARQNWKSGATLVPM